MTTLSDQQDHNDIVELTAKVASAFVANNAVAAGDLPKLIVDIHVALHTLASPPPELEEKPEPAVPVRKSVTPDFMICLEDGRKFKSLKRHLRIRHGLTPAEYRRKWNLPADYPMVAPNYAASRSALAKAAGLGQVRKVAPSPKQAPRTRKTAGQPNKLAPPTQKRTRKVPA